MNYFAFIVIIQNKDVHAEPSFRGKIRYRKHQPFCFVSRWLVRCLTGSLPTRCGECRSSWASSTPTGTWRSRPSSWRRATWRSSSSRYSPQCAVTTRYVGNIIILRVRGCGSLEAPRPWSSGSGFKCVISPSYSELSVPGCYAIWDGTVYCLGAAEE